MHDFVAVGIGPFNLGLACLTQPIPELDGVFLERKPAFDWHPGMLLENSTLQTPFLADLVTLADPTSAFSFLNYLKQAGRLYPFYIRESFHPFRTEYNAYCRWAAGRLPNLRFGRDVEDVGYDESAGAYVVHARVASTGRRESYAGRRLVLGVGTTPYVPPPCRDLPGAVHSADYLDERARLRGTGSIVVVGSGQSAAEIYHDLLGDIDTAGYALTWVTRSPRFFPLEYTKLTLEMTSPEYSAYFYDLPAGTRDRLVDSQQNLYQGIDSALVDGIFDLLYAKSLRGPVPARLLTNSELVRAELDGAGRYVLGFRHVEQGREFELAADGLVLATGYRTEVPAFLAGVADRIRRDDRGRFAVNRNYSVDRAGREIFVQNAELHTHGFVAPDLGMAAHRNSCLIRELLGREHYPVERSIAFQEFGVPAAPAAPAGPA